MLLHGYRFSVYARIARLTLLEKGVAFAWREVDPFAPLPADHPHPFGRVPVLEHDGFRLYETQAIARFVDAAFPGPPLVPVGPRAAARMTQVIGVADAYLYWPLVRQVFSHAVFRPAAGEPSDPLAIAEGLAAAPRLLAALEDIAAEGMVLAGPVTLADLHLMPMLAYFAAAPQGAALLARHPALFVRFSEIAARPAFAATEPGLPGPYQAKTP